MPFVSIEWNMGDIISPATKICKDYLSWIKLFNTSAHLNLSIILDLGERWSLIFPKLVHIRFRWTLPRMRDRVTSKRLTASGYSLIYDSQ